MRTFVEIAQLAGYGVQLSEYDSKNLGELKKEYSAFAPLCRLVEVAYLSHYDEKHHVEGAGVLLEYKGHLLRPYKCHYTDKAYKFVFAQHYEHKHTKSYMNRNEKPNKVGAPTAKKLDEWLNFLLNEEEEKKAYAQEYIDQEAEFRAELAELGEAVRWHDNGNKGHIEMNNLIFSFSIEPCYISKTVKIDRSYDLGLSGFLQMADNKYRPAERQ